MNKTEKVPTFRAPADSGGEMIPKENNNIKMHIMINCDKSYKGKIQGVMTQNNRRVGHV